MVKKGIKFRDGFSESAWKSLVIKSLRIGWVEGLDMASKVLPPSMMKPLLTAGLFEDVFPASWEELNECLKEIETKNWEALCSRQTHHGRAYTERFCDLEDEAIKWGRLKGTDIMKNLVIPNSNLKWLNPRVYNCLYTWAKITPEDVGIKRTPLYLEFLGMPECVLDGHTFEGKRQCREVTLLSGHYENHRLIGQRVMQEGWDGIRKRFINGLFIRPDHIGKQGELILHEGLQKRSPFLFL